MKKTIILSMALVAMMSSCSTMEIAESTASTEAIGFSTFIDKSVVDKSEEGSKAVVTTLSNIDYTAMYAYYTSSSTWTGRSYISTFMNCVAMTILDAGTTTYAGNAYWPSDGGKVSFFSVGPATSSDSGETVISPVTITAAGVSDNFKFDYTTPAAVASQKDLVVSRNFNLSSTSTEATTGISLVYNHILSKIGVGAYLTSTYDNTVVTVTDVEITYASGKVVSSGTYNLGAEEVAASWTLGSTYFTADTNTTGDMLTAAAGAVVSATVSTSYNAITDDFIMLIPQQLSTAGDLKATIKYDVENTSTEFVAHYTASVDLPAYTFAEGKQYTFVVQFNLTRNLIIFATTEVNDFDTDTSIESGTVKVTTED